jgi:DNA-binding transcriptional ArsR family regulator
MDETLNDILNTEIKVKILRLFAQRQDGYQATGREVARQIRTTAPSAHAALKALYDQHIVLMEAIGRSHVYQLNRKNRVVQDILLPAFSVEKNFKDDMAQFLARMIKDAGLEKKIVSMLFYGSRQQGHPQKGSDADIAVIVAREPDEERVLQAFLDQISPEFFTYFGVSLDPYVKSKKSFQDLFKRDLPPVSTLTVSYDVIFGEDVIKGGK